MSRQFKIKWHDSGREPQCEPDPDYPSGKDVDGSFGLPSCETPLPYPARRCGHYVVRCRLCGYSVAITTAGRPDDPRSLRMPCDLVKKGTEH
jgi:hypothetical protein